MEKENRNNSMKETNGQKYFNSKIQSMISKICKEMQEWWVTGIEFDEWHVSSSR